jgi:pyruvyltransferase
MSGEDMESDTVRCWSKGGPGNKVWNWGDAISPTLFESITGAAPKILDYTDLGADPHIMICGSTMKWTTAGSILWGIGEIADDMKFVVPGVRPLGVAAVRGPLTRQRLIRAGIDCPDVYGDPALLFPRFYRPSSEKTHALGVIPHYVDIDLPRLGLLRNDPRVKVIDITQANTPVEDRIVSFINEVASCRAIVSSSLHGVILADAYGIPAKWMRLSELVYGGGFKFRDYFQSVDQAARADAPLTALGGFDEIIAAVQSDFVAFGAVRLDLDRLLAAFPGPKTRLEERTDLARWRAVANATPPWDARNIKIARHLCEKDVVIDFGAGRQTIRQHANLTAYTPVDCVAPAEGVFVCDYNKDMRFPDATPTVIVMSGFLEYILEPARFLQALKERYPGARCLFSWAYVPHETDARREHGWIAALNPALGDLTPFEPYFAGLTVIDRHETTATKQLIFEGYL